VHVSERAKTSSVTCRINAKSEKEEWRSVGTLTRHCSLSNVDLRSDLRFFLFVLFFYVTEAQSAQENGGVVV
jgi:hypothetical protein